MLVKKATEAFKAAAKQLKEDGLIFSFASIEEEFGGRLSEFLGIEEDALPVVRLVQPKDNIKKYVFEKEITEENIKSFVRDFRDNKLKPYFKSQPIPTESHENGVRTIVGKNFEEIVLDSTKDVLVEYYAPWCGHCKHLAPIYESLASRLKGSENLIIAKMDATANEVESVAVEGFPTIKFYPANKKQSPIDFEGERDEEGFVQFLKQHATVTIHDSEPHKSETEDSAKRESVVDRDL